MRGDLQEGYFALLDANFLSSWCQFPFSRAQNRGFCAFLPFETLIFGLFEHKIGIFVRFYPLNPPFSGISSTKSTFSCSGRRGNCYEALPGGDAAERCLVEMRRSAAQWRCCKHCPVEMLQALLSGDAAERCLVEMLRSAAQWRCCEALPGGDAAERCPVEMLQALLALLDEGTVA